MDSVIQLLNTWASTTIFSICGRDVYITTGKNNTVFCSLRTADVSPRSSPLRDVPPRETSLNGDERGETSAVRRLGLLKFNEYHCKSIVMSHMKVLPINFCSNAQPLAFIHRLKVILFVREYKQCQLAGKYCHLISF